MVFAVNAPEHGNTLDAFCRAAKATPSITTRTYDAEPAVHTVTVGGPSGLVYTPNRIDANPGDIVQFKFLSKNHTATQSSFEKPCQPAEFQTGIIGFDSGLYVALSFVPGPISLMCIHSIACPPPMMHL
jgi:plastocyanin